MEIERKKYKAVGGLLANGIIFSAAVIMTHVTRIFLYLTLPLKFREIFRNNSPSADSLLTFGEAPRL